ncbi:MAG TPA: lipopolysaccharide biosynthesis protein [Sphingobacteriaceae bacterium]
MEEIVKFYQFLLRYRIVLIVVPVITVIIAYFLVRNLPNVYVSTAQIATGIVDNTQPSVFAQASGLQESKINQDFSNLLQMMQMERIVGQVSYKLILNDLTTSKPFRPKSPLLKELNQYALKHAVEVYTKKYKARESLNLWDSDQNGLHRVLASMGYDQGSLKGKLRTYRVGTSDFIQIDFESENPELSAFVVNTLTREFIDYYTSLTNENRVKSLNFLKNLTETKNKDLNDKVQKLQSYKIANKVLNLNEQSSQLYTQILEYTNRKQEAIKNVAAYQGAVNNIDRQFSPNDRRYIEASMTRVNQSILQSKENLRTLYDRYIDSDFDQQYKNAIDSTQDVLSGQINTLSDKYIVNPLSTKQSLIQQKLNLQIQLDLARYSINAITSQINQLTGQFNRLVPHEAVVQSLERDIEVASKEYLDVLQRYNQVSMEADFSTKLKQVQQATPGFPQASKKLLLVIISGVISFVFCLAVIFLIFFFDKSIRTPKELANKTGLPVLGFLNLFENFSLAFIRNGDQNVTLVKLKDQLRSLRFEIEKEMGTDSRVLGITSLVPLEGKTFSILGLAYSFSQMNKKVLVIDGNFTQPVISSISKPDAYFEDVVVTNSLDFISFKQITILGNRGSDKSLLEITTREKVDKLLQSLKPHFDIIIIETPALNIALQGREWFQFSQRILAVFEAGKCITDEEQEYVDYFGSLKGSFIGWIFNKVPLKQKKRKG